MRYLYYCNSTYQILNVLNLNWHRRYAGFEHIEDYHSDLVVLNTFEGAEQIAEIIRQSGVFDHVMLMKKTFNTGVFHSLLTLIDTVSPLFYMWNKHGVRKGEILDKYDVITTPKYSSLIDAIWQLNRKARLDLIEDGTATYNMVINLKSNSGKIEKLRQMLSYNDFHDYENLYLVSKNLYSGINPEKVIEIPAFDESYLEKIKNDFSAFSDKYAQKDVYWLSQFLNNEEFNRMVDKVLSLVSPYKDDVLFVQHPRKHMDNKYGFAETDGKQIWELMMLKMKDINSKLFISIHSTASYTAKMLYGLEPYIILFYKLGDRKVTAANDDFESFLEKFKANYSDPDKIMVPETIEEFKECLERYYVLTGKQRDRGPDNI